MAALISEEALRFGGMKLLISKRYGVGGKGKSGEIRGLGGSIP